MGIIKFIGFGLQFLSHQRIAIFFIEKVLRSPIVKGAAGSFGLKIVSLGISFVTNVVLARLLGATDYGTYVYVLAWVTFLGIPACMGLPGYVAREVAVYRAQKNWAYLKGLIYWASQVVFLASLVIAILAAGVVAILDLSSQMRSIFWLMLLSFPLVTLTSVRQAAMNGFNKVVAGDFPELLVKPLLFLVLVSLGYGLSLPLDSNWVMGIYGVTVMVAFGFGVLQLRRAWPNEMSDVLPLTKSLLWFKATLPFLLIVAMFVVNQQTDVIMLGLLQGTEQAGIYTVVGRGTQLIQFALMAISASTTPVLAGLLSREDWTGVRSVLRTSSRLLIVATFAISMTLMVFGQWFLLIFGSEFVAGQMALVVLAIGYLLSCPLELSGLLLLMSGHERDTAIGTGISAAANLVLNTLLIPLWGMSGAALATTISMLVRGLCFVFCAHQRLKIVPNPMI